MIGGEMVDQIIERLKDKVLPAPTYKTVSVAVKDRKELLKLAGKNDILTLVGSADVIGMKAGSQHKIKSVSGETITLQGGKQVMAEWFEPVIKRQQRVRRRVDMDSIRAIASEFSSLRWIAFGKTYDTRVKESDAEIAQAEKNLESARVHLKNSREHLTKLVKSRDEEPAWVKSLSDRMILLVSSKRYVNFEYGKEKEWAVLVAYTGPITDRNKKRAEFLVKVYPDGAKTRIVVENITPGRESNDVPNGGYTGICNLCLGTQNENLKEAVYDEEWGKALTIVHRFLTGKQPS